MAEKKSNQTRNNRSSSIPPINNLVVFIIMIALIYAISQIYGYKWLISNIIEDNIKIIEKHPNLSYEKKMEAKLGGPATYLLHLKKNTPKNATILFPPDSLMNIENAPENPNKWLKGKSWTSYFLYPRRVVYEREKGSSLIYDSVTHVAIMNHWGYNKLKDYTVTTQSEFNVLPLTRAQLQQEKSTQ